MRYKDIINEARKKGITTEAAMIKSIDQVDSMLNDLEEEHPEEYWKFMRKLHENLYGPHYSKEFAEWDLSNIWYTDKQGRKQEGPHWSCDEVITVMQDHPYPAGTTDADKWVAANVIYADLCKVLEEDAIISVAYYFFFADEDAEEGKIWHYMCM